MPHPAPQGPNQPHAPGPAALPAFGFWKRDPDDPSRLSCRIIRRGESLYEISLTFNPASDNITEFRVKDCRDSSSPSGHGSSFSSLIANDLPEDLSGRIMRRLVLTKESIDARTLLSNIKSTVDELLTGAPLEAFKEPETLNKVVIHRCDNGRALDTIRELALLLETKTKRKFAQLPEGAPADFMVEGDAEESVESDPGAQAVPGMLGLSSARALMRAAAQSTLANRTEITDTLVASLRLFKEADRSAVLQHLFDVLEASNERAVFLKAVWRPRKALPYESLSHVKTELIETLLTDCAKGANTQQPARERARRISTVLGLLRVRPEQEQRPLVKAFIDRLARMNLAHEIIERMRSGAPFSGAAASEIPGCLYGIPGEIARAICVRDKSGQYLSTVLANADSFDDLDINRLCLDFLRTRGSPVALVSQLHRVKGLDFEIAEAAVAAAARALEDRGNPAVYKNDDLAVVLRSLLSNFQRFQAAPERKAAIVEKALQSPEAEAILQNLGAIPREVLRILEPAHYLMAYQQDLGLPSIRAYSLYCELKRAGHEGKLAETCTELKHLSETIVSSDEQPESITKHPFYRELVSAMYPPHTDYARYEASESCPDRTSDIRRFTFQPRYRIDLAEGVMMVLRPGKRADAGAVHTICHNIATAQTLFVRQGFEKSQVLAAVRKQLEAKAKLPDVFKTDEEKIFGSFLAACIGGKGMDTARQIAIGYQLSRFDDLQRYVLGTKDHASQAPNPEHAHLLELREFFTSDMHDALKHILQEAGRNQMLLGFLPRLGLKFAGRQREAEIAEQFTRRQANKMGATPGFLVRLEAGWRNGAPGGRKQIVARMIKSEQERVASLIESITGSRPSADDIHLGEFDAGKLKAELSRASISPAPEEIFGLLARDFLALFQPELVLLDAELAKYQPEHTTQRQARVLEAFFTKNHTSAHARGTAGVCVSADNPNNQDQGFLDRLLTSKQEKERCIWNLPNYFQLVLRDPVSYRCEGMVLLHHYHDQGRMILSASFNPSSTYLLKVDQRQLFSGLLKILVSFAQENHFDFVTCSAHSMIRTNRTGGEFACALQEAVARKNKRISLSRPQAFSFWPRYYLDELDVLWERQGPGLI